MNKTLCAMAVAALLSGSLGSASAQPTGADAAGRNTTSSGTPANNSNPSGEAKGRPAITPQDNHTSDASNRAKGAGSAATPETKNNSAGPVTTSGGEKNEPCNSGTACGE